MGPIIRTEGEYILLVKFIPVLVSTVFSLQSHAGFSEFLDHISGEFELTDSKKPVVPIESEAYFKEFESFKLLHSADSKIVKPIVKFINNEKLCPEGEFSGNSKTKNITFGILNDEPFKFTPIDGETYKFDSVERDKSGKPLCHSSTRYHYEDLLAKTILERTDLCLGEDVIEQITVDYSKPDMVQITRYYDVYDKVKHTRSPYLILCIYEQEQVEQPEKTLQPEKSESAEKNKKK